MDTTQILIAFLLTLFAGLSTGLGSALAFFTKRTNTSFLSAALGFSAGVMIYVSMVDILAKAKETLTEELGAFNGPWATLVAFFGGVVLIGFIDRIIPKWDNPHELRLVEDMGRKGFERNAPELFRIGLLSAFAIAIHNFPEGLATFATSIKDLKLGIPIALAVAIHNIPEGIAVSVPIYFATGQKRKAFLYSFMSGLSEPFGALVGYLVLYRFLNDLVFGVLYASVAGIMVFISVDELLPAAREYGEPHISIYGLFAGMAVMAVSLLLLE